MSMNQLATDQIYTLLMHSIAERVPPAANHSSPQLAPHATHTFAVHLCAAEQHNTRGLPHTHIFLPLKDPLSVVSDAGCCARVVTCCTQCAMQTPTAWSVHVGRSNPKDHHHPQLHVHETLVSHSGNETAARQHTA